ncbi:MAG: winged helix-turn-helix transcriptional regulator [Candidatus Bathyarchaeota archaeon]|nr:MAG: winged helix-turn-helix transcriptional regulator [Candidatus Bathyarchaeota archaeon]
MRPIKVIKDPDAFKLLGDSTRRKIVFLLRVKEMTVSQIAAELSLTPQAVYHHIKKLLKGEMVEVAREERVDHLIESYYQATAEVFHCSVGQTKRGAEIARDNIRTMLNALKKLGFELQFDEKAVSQLVDIEMHIQHHLEECCDSKKIEDKVAKLDDVDFLTKQSVQKYAEILSMSDEDYEKHQKNSKKSRELIRSLIKK